MGTYELEVTLTMPDGSEQKLSIPVTEENYSIIESIMKQALEERQDEYNRNWQEYLRQLTEESEE